MNEEKHVYRTGEEFRTEHIRSHGLHGDGCFTILLMSGILTFPIGCEVTSVLTKTNISEFNGMMVLLIVLATPLGILGLLQAKEGWKRSRKMDRLMKNAKDVAVPNLPHAWIGDVGHDTYQELLSRAEANHMTVENVLQEDVDNYLYSDRE